jgi:cyclophilin family peptidyl-prolyl cis-trans isomerase
MNVCSLPITIAACVAATMVAGAASAQTKSTGARKGGTTGGTKAGTTSRGAATATANKAKLRTPSALNEKAPDTYKAKFDTSQGIFIVEVHRDWAPLGADRFYNLVKNGFYDDTRFFRVLDGFMAQFGINGDPKISAAWREARIQDDPVKQSNRRGFVTYAMAGPHTRTSQIFINYGDNSALDRQNFSPFGRVSSGMEVVDALYNGYGEGAPRGQGPDQGRVQMEGNAYLTKNFPRLDFVKKATITK